MKPFFKLNYPHVDQKQNLVYCNSQNMPLHSYNKLFLLGEDLRKDKVGFLKLYPHRNYNYAIQYTYYNT